MRRRRARCGPRRRCRRGAAPPQGVAQQWVERRQGGVQHCGVVEPARGDEHPHRHVSIVAEGSGSTASRLAPIGSICSRELGPADLTSPASSAWVTSWPSRWRREPVLVAPGGLQQRRAGSGSGSPGTPESTTPIRAGRSPRSPWRPGRRCRPAREAGQQEGAGRLDLALRHVPIPTHIRNRPGARGRCRSASSSPSDPGLGQLHVEGQRQGTDRRSSASRAPRCRRRCGRCGWPAARARGSRSRSLAVVDVGRQVAHRPHQGAGREHGVAAGSSEQVLDPGGDRGAAAGAVVTPAAWRASSRAASAEPSSWARSSAASTSAISCGRSAWPVRPLSRTNRSWRRTASARFPLSASRSEANARTGGSSEKSGSSASPARRRRGRRRQGREEVERHPRRTAPPRRSPRGWWGPRTPTSPRAARRPARGAGRRSRRARRTGFGGVPGSRRCTVEQPVPGGLRELRGHQGERHRPGAGGRQLDRERKPPDGTADLARRRAGRPRSAGG